ncbi:unnamed protein product [Paramecium primaurelia]|uniref:Palmitoyltransferase n=1 Tax=Paramecium primaurelia TaxID=5886 RepID=A0A8S1K6F0_PARPR|nr:unnamed protein product [Paramecium primaurelia]
MNTTEKEYKTINGFTRPKHPFQIFTMIFFIQLMCCVSIAIMPLTNLLVQIILASFFYFFSMMIFYYAFKASYIDPTDDLIIQSKRGQSFENMQELYDFYCSFCDSYVSSTTKHCRVCERKKELSRILQVINICIIIWSNFYNIWIVFNCILITKINDLDISKCWFSSNIVFTKFQLNVFSFLVKILRSNNLCFYYIKKIKEILRSSNRNSIKVLVFNSTQIFFISCSIKKNRIAQVNPKQDYTQGEEQLYKNEVIQHELPTDIKQQNVEIEGDAESVPDKSSKRKISSHTINSQINNQIQE